MLPQGLTDSRCFGTLKKQVGCVPAFLKFSQCFTPDIGYPLTILRHTLSRDIQRKAGRPRLPDVSVKAPQFGSSDPDFWAGLGWDAYALTRCLHDMFKVKCHINVK